MLYKEEIHIDTELQQLLNSGQAWSYRIVPCENNSDQIRFYHHFDESSEAFADELELIFGKDISFIETEHQTLLKALGKYYRKTDQAASREIELNRGGEDDLLSKLIREAKDFGSSDIHIEIYEHRCRVRMRIDGKLVERYVIDSNHFPSLINRIKIRSNLDIAEKRLPQDGRISYQDENDSFDIRVSVLPTLYGEKAVLRLLTREAGTIDIKKLGFSDKEMQDYLEGVKRSHGVVLISGPTGSGKTTSLYATLQVLNKDSANILTIEDPIEYTLEGVNQVQLKESIGMDFASALRTFLRQDPDIIMVGEIRDEATAQMAIRAALTGHLVLSTIHTNSAWGTVSRLIDMGIPPFLIASTLNLSVAQRLVRLLCPVCKLEEKLDSNALPHNFIPPRALETHYVAQGCQECHYTGYRGRKAIYEVIPVDHFLAGEIKKNSFDVSDYLTEKKIPGLQLNAFQLMEKGATSLEEVYAILMSNH